VENLHKATGHPNAREGGKSYTSYLGNASNAIITFTEKKKSTDALLSRAQREPRRRGKVGLGTRDEFED